MDKLQRIYCSFSPDPLKCDQMSLYVDLSEVRGDHNVVERLAGKIRLSQRPFYQVVAGHTGSGKSTELTRLQSTLEEDGFFAVFCEALEDVDQNDVDFPDLLIAAIRQIAAQLRDRLGINLKPGYFQDRVQRLKTLLGSEIGFEGMELDAGLFKISSTIKNSPDTRAEVRKLLDPDTSNRLTAANEVITEALAALTKKDY